MLFQVSVVSQAPFPHLILENLDSRSHVPEFVQFICAEEGSSFSFYLPYFISERQKLEKRNKQDFQSQCIWVCSPSVVSSSFGPHAL